MPPSPRRSSRRASRGFSTIVILFAVVLCAAVASAVVYANAGSSKQAQGSLAREKAFQAADAGIDWGVNRVRILKGVIPSPAQESRDLPNTGRVTIDYAAGNADGLDDDGDGTADEADEDQYILVTSTGFSGQMSRRLQAVLLIEIVAPTFPAATHIADESPTVDLSGAAFRISGEDHFIDGTPDATRPPVFGISSEADPSVLDPQIRAPNRDQITGTGGEPSIGQSTTFYLEELMELADAAATIELEPGTHRDDNLGTPTQDGVEIVRCMGDLHVSGNTTGAGLLVIHGDLTITGDFTWVGIVLVEGRVRMNGGGSTIRLIGALACGDEITDSLTVAGTVDLYYSSDAIRLASTLLAVPVIKAWRETGIL